MISRQNTQPLINEIVSFFDYALNGNFLGEKAAGIPINFQESPHCWKLHGSLPGFKNEEIKVSVDKGILKILAEKPMEEFKEDENENELKWTYAYEWSVDKAQRSFKLPIEVDEEKISVEYTNGILIINLPKKEDAMTVKTFEVK